MLKNQGFQNYVLPNEMQSYGTSQDILLKLIYLILFNFIFLTDKSAEQIVD